MCDSKDILPDDHIRTLELTKEDIEKIREVNPELFKKQFMIRDSYTVGQDLELNSLRD